MKYKVVQIFLLLSFLAGEKTLIAKTYGEPISLKTQTPLEKALKDFSSFENRDILCEVTVEKVCQKKGCWFGVKTGDDSIRVTSKDYGFFIPTDSGGKRVTVRGKLVKKTVSVADLKHFAKDAGKSQKEIDQIKNEKTEFESIASGLVIN